MKLLLKNLIALLFISNSCFALEETDLFKKPANTADYVVLAKKISGRLSCDIYSGDRINSREDMCSDKTFLRRINEYNRLVQKDEYVVLTTYFGKKQPGDILTFDISNVDYTRTSLSQNYLLFVYDDSGVLYYHPCEVFDYENVENILNKKPSMDALFNTLKEKPNGSCFLNPPASKQIK